MTNGCKYVLLFNPLAHFFFIFKRMNVTNEITKIFPSILFTKIICSIHTTHIWYFHYSTSISIFIHWNLRILKPKYQIIYKRQKISKNYEVYSFFFLFLSVNGKFTLFKNEQESPSHFCSVFTVLNKYMHVQHQFLNLPN